MSVPEEYFGTHLACDSSNELYEYGCASSTTQRMFEELTTINQWQQPIALRAARLSIHA